MSERLTCGFQFPGQPYQGVGLREQPGGVRCPMEVRFQLHLDPTQGISPSEQLFGTDFLREEHRISVPALLGFSVMLSCSLGHPRGHNRAINTAGGTYGFAMF